MPHQLGYGHSASIHPLRTLDFQVSMNSMRKFMHLPSKDGTEV